MLKLVRADHFGKDVARLLDETSAGRNTAAGVVRTSKPGRLG
jgi:hypothetical protein